MALKTKICTDCNLEKDAISFAKMSASADLLQYRCRDCAKHYREKHKDHKKQRDLEYRLLHKEERAIYDKMIYDRDKEKIKIRSSLYYENNKTNLIEQAAVYAKNRRSKDPDYKIRGNLRSRLKKALKENWKTGSAIEDLGCTVEKLIIHLESKFYAAPYDYGNVIKGSLMTWENYGQFGWHIDHIIPLASFDLKIREKFLKACHYSNLQPMWWFQNIKKGIK